MNKLLKIYCPFSAAKGTFRERDDTVGHETRGRGITLGTGRSRTTSGAGGGTTVREGRGTTSRAGGGTTVREGRGTTSRAGEGTTVREGRGTTSGIGRRTTVLEGERQYLEKGKDHVWR